MAHPDEELTNAAGALQTCNAYKGKPVLDMPQCALLELHKSELHMLAEGSLQHDLPRPSGRACSTQQESMCTASIHGKHEPLTLSYVLHFSHGNLQKACTAFRHVHLKKAAPFRSTPIECKGQGWSNYSHLSLIGSDLETAQSARPIRKGCCAADWDRSRW